jgi:ATP-dependent DNA helicase RecG
VAPTLQQLHHWLGARENEHLEFKEAKEGFHFEKLAKYCAALANEGGGYIILGVTDRRPRRVVGTAAFDNLERTKSGLLERLRVRIEVSELAHPDGRVLVFNAPARAIGVPVAVEGAYWMRAGEELRPMTVDVLRRIFDEARPDFSAEISDGATLSDLDPKAIEEFRRRWHGRAHLPTILTMPTERLLRDAELITQHGVTYAALIMLGTRAAITEYLAAAEVVFEYRSSEAAGPANQREEFRCGFLLYYDRVWELINLRNDKQHYQAGLIMYDVPTFSEPSVREAFLNAVAHRDYRHPGSIFVRQYTRRLEVVSPGGLPTGITVKNILYQQNPRNRRLADTFARCGWVDRAGQGADRMFEECVLQGKELPDFTHTDAYQVFLTLHGEIDESGFLQFLLRIRDENICELVTQELLVLDFVRHERRVPVELRPWLRKLTGLGVLETHGRGRGTQYIFSPRLFSAPGRFEVDTRRGRLDRAKNRSLLLERVIANAGTGTRFVEFQCEVLPDLSRDQIQTLLKELKEDGLVFARGIKRAARWYSVPPKTQTEANAIEKSVDILSKSDA